jgi:hypothetical protein
MHPAIGNRDWLIIVLAALGAIAFLFVSAYLFS